MESRRYPIQQKFRVDEAELQQIEEKMQQVPTTNKNLFYRKMVLDGYIVKKDVEGIAEIRKLVQEFSRISSNINQIAKRANTTGHAYGEDLAEIRRTVEEIWQLLRSGLLSRL